MPKSPTPGRALQGTFLPAAPVLAVLAALFIGSLAALPARAAPYAAIVVDVQTGEVLHSRQADARRYPASLTKMMTLYLLFEAIDLGQLQLDSALSVSQKATRQPPSRLALKGGSTITARQAILALVTKSANDVAVVVAEAVAGSEAAFAKRMTLRAHELGMTGTQFRNASGLPHRQQFTTARDMATLAEALVTDFPHYYGYFATKRFRYGKLRFRNHNKLLGRYDGVDGVKTGYIRASGYNLVASAVRDGRRLIAVVMGGRSSKWRDSRTASLLNMGFERLHQIRIAEALQQFRPRPKPGTEAAVAFAEYRASLPAAEVQQASFEQEAAAEAVVDLQPGAGAPQRVAAATDAIPIPRPKPQVRSAAATIPVPLPKPTLRSASIPVPQPKPHLHSASAIVPVPLPKPEHTPQQRQVAAGAWGIQVGAFSRRAPAYLAIERAQRYAPRLLLSSLIRIEEVTSSRRKLFRARMLGLEEAAARTACQVLKKQSMACLLVPPDARITVAAND